MVARTQGGDRVLGRAGTLLARCQEAGLPLASACSGRGACGRCAVAILGPGAQLEAPGPHEREVLARNRLPSNHRLACQCTPPASAPDLVITTGYW